MSREGGLEHLTLKPRIRTILTGWERNQDWRFEQAKDRLAAANDAIRTTRTFFFALLSTRLTSAPSSPARPGGVEFQRAGMLTEVRRGRREPRPTTKAVGSPASEGARSRLERFAPIDCPLPALALAHLPAPSLLPWSAARLAAPGTGPASPSISLRALYSTGRLVAARLSRRTERKESGRVEKGFQGQGQTKLTDP